jgi:hypothetical protein
MASAKAGSVAWSKFAGWSVAGFGGAALLILTQAQTVSANFARASTKWAVGLYLVALAIAVLEKFISTYVDAATGSAESLQGRFVEPLDPEELQSAFKDVQTSAIGLQGALARIIVKRHTDVVSVPRFVFRLVIVQAHLSVAIVALEISAALIFMSGYHTS